MLSETLQYLLSCLLDIGLPDLGEHPGWCALGIFYLFSLSGKYMHLFGSSFTYIDIRIAPVRGFEGCLLWPLSCEYSDLVAVPGT